MRLHGYWRSSAAYRVRIALNLKGLAYDQQVYDLRTGAQREPAYLAIAPQGLVPALEANGQVLTQSLAIMEWLEETHPAPALLPTDAEGRAVVRAMSALISSDIHPLGNLRVLQALRHRFGADQAAVEDWAAHWITEGFEALETLIVRHGAGFSYGDTPTMADCCLLPQAYNAQRYRVDLGRFPRVRDAVERAKALPAVQAAAPEQQPDAGA
jgi:maleylpyruvate isomerase